MSRQVTCQAWPDMSGEMVGRMVGRTVGPIILARQDGTVGPIILHVQDDGEARQDDFPVRGHHPGLCYSMNKVIKILRINAQKNLFRRARGCFCDQGHLAYPTDCLA